MAQESKTPAGIDLNDDGYVIATRLSMEHYAAQEHDGKLICWSPATGEQASATPGDYFAVDAEEWLEDSSGEPMLLGYFFPETIHAVGIRTEDDDQAQDEGGISLPRSVTCPARAYEIATYVGDVDQPWGERPHVLASELPSAIVTMVAPLKFAEELNARSMAAALTHSVAAAGRMGRAEVGGYLGGGAGFRVTVAALA